MKTFLCADNTNREFVFTMLKNTFSLFFELDQEVTTDFNVKHHIVFTLVFDMH